ncbi:MAG: NADP-dependent oxidoreductase [Candidatus Baltobacteraceae bacterium]
MKAMRYHAYDAPLQLEDVPTPQPAADEVLIRVADVSVNPFDAKVRAGAFKGTLPKAFPATPGLEAAGVATAVGAEVEGVAVGDQVYAKVSAGYAEFALAKSNEIARKPPRLSFPEAAAVPVAIETAWSVLFDVAGLQRGQRVLVNGAAGSVGSVAVQLAKWKGALVFGTASPDNLDFVRTLGAEPVDYTTTSLASVVTDIDVIFDTVGGAEQDGLFATMRKGGVLVSIVRPPSQALAKERGVRALGRFGTTDPLTIRKTQHLVDDGIVRPTVRRLFPLEDANAAEALSQSGRGRGKVVLHVWDP